MAASGLLTARDADAAPVPNETVAKAVIETEAAPIEIHRLVGFRGALNLCRIFMFSPCNGLASKWLGILVLHPPKVALPPLGPYRTG
jgi:hypothetical protein